MNILQEEIAEKLKKLQSVMRDNKAKETQGVLVKEGSLFACGETLSMWAKLSVKEEQSYVLPPAAIKLLDSLSPGMITISGSDSQVEIQAKGIKNTFQTFPASRYQLEELLDYEEGMEIPIVRMRDALRCTSACAATSIERAFYTGVLWEAKDGFLHIVSTDGYALAWKKIEFEGSFKFILPKMTIEKLLETCEDEKLKIVKEKQKVVFQTGDYTISSRLLQGEENYLDYTKMVVQGASSASISKESLALAARRALISAEDSGIAGFTIQDGCLTLTAQSDVGDYTEKLELEKGESEISENQKWIRLPYLANVLKAYYYDTVRIGFAKKPPSMQISSPNKDLHMILVLAAPKAKAEGKAA